jgi:hypothetical protein
LGYFSHWGALVCVGSFGGGASGWICFLSLIFVFATVLDILLLLRYIFTR